MKWNSTFPIPSTKQKPPSVRKTCTLRPQSIIEQYTKTLTHHIDAYGRDIGYYAFGDIGNRETGAQRNEQTRQRRSGDIEQLRFSVEKRVREACAPKRQGKTYTANWLNQYSQINEGIDSTNPQSLIPNNSVESPTFVPFYDANGNQTLVQTSTGTWAVTHNAENRPITWTQGDTVITMEYDYFGRRISYQKMQGNTQISHTKFLYKGFLCVQELSADTPWNVLKEFVWDPTEPTATKPLCFRMPALERRLFYMHDGNKNVSDVIYRSVANGIGAHYEYAPFGAASHVSHAAATANLRMIMLNPFRFSSEWYDDDLGLVYYNYRHYNPLDGRFINRDPIEEEGGLNLYKMSGNNTISMFDFLGLNGSSSKECKNLKQKFLDWYKKEMNDPKWKEQLETMKKNSPCPEKLTYVPATHSKTPIQNSSTMMTSPSPGTPQGCKNPNEDKFEMSSTKNYTDNFRYTAGEYHPGGVYELRTKHEKDYMGPGNQCIYDKCCKLMTKIPAAGTADRFSPHDFTKWKYIWRMEMPAHEAHMKHDVEPYKWAVGLDKDCRGDGQGVNYYLEMYYECRPQVNQ